MIKNILNKIQKKIQSESLLHQLVKFTSYTFLIRTFGAISSYVLVLLITQLYSSEIFGIYSITQTILLILALLCRLGFDTGSLRLVSKYYAVNDFSTIRFIYFKIVKLVFPISVLVSFLLYYFSYFISINIFDNILLYKPIQYISLAIIPFTFLLIHSESLRGMNRIVYYALFRSMTLPFLTTIFLIVFYYNRILLIETPILALLISIWLLFIISSFVFKKEINIKETSNNIISYKKMLSISLPMLLTGSMFYLLQWADTLILGIYLPESKVGIYNVSMKISLVTTILLFSINSYAAPKFSECYSTGNLSKLKKIIYYTTGLMFYTSLPILILVLFFSNNILAIFGDEYIIAKYSLIFLSIGQFINAISGSVGYILQMTNNQKTFQYIMMSSVILNIVLNILLIPSFGINGAAFSSMLSYMLWNILGIIFIYKKLSILTIYLPNFIRNKI